MSPRVESDEKRFSLFAALLGGFRKRRKSPVTKTRTSFVVPLRLRRGFAPLARARAHVMVGVGCMPSLAQRRRARDANHDVAAGPSLHSLPVDVLLQVTQLLGGNDLLRCAAVCRAWRDALEPAFESKCVSHAREIRAWRFPETSSIETRSKPRGNSRERFRALSPPNLTWRECFRNEFCSWCREAPNERVNLVATFQGEPRGWNWSRLASRGLIAPSARPCPVPNGTARRKSVTLCGKCLASAEATASTRAYCMELGAPPPLERPDRKPEALSRVADETGRPSFRHENGGTVRERHPRPAMDDSRRDCFFR